MAQFVNPDLSLYPPALVAAFEAMNEQQRRAASLNGGLAAICGVPGSGKTRCVINLLARLVAEGLDPSRILAMTFTRNAAQEMNERLAGMGIVGARIGTIHSVCRQLLATETRLVAENQLDERNRMNLELKKVLTDFRRAKKIPRTGVDKEQVSKFISACKARGAGWVIGNPFQLNAQLEAALYRVADEFRTRSGMERRMLAQVYFELERRRGGRALYDFDDMILWAWLVLVADVSVRSRWRQKYSVVIVDEAQDSSAVQWDVSRLLCGLSSCILTGEEPEPDSATNYIEVDRQYLIAEDALPKALYVYGDVCQSLYRFREAIPEIFVEFANRADVEVIPLPLNYRSTPGICAMGTELVRGKPWNLGGEMVAAGAYQEVPLESSLPVVRPFTSPELEAASAVTWAMEHAASEGASLDSTVLLSRMSLALHLAEIECIRNRIPYRKLAGGSFFETKEIRDVLAYVRVAAGRDYDGKALRRIVNVPFRYLGTAFISSCESAAARDSVSLLDAMQAQSRSLSPPQRRAIDALAALLMEMNEQALAAEEMEAEATPESSSPESPQQLQQPQQPGMQQAEPEEDLETNRSYIGPAAMIATMLDKTDYIEELRKEDGLGEENTRVAMIGELQRIAELFRSPVRFLEYVDQLAAAVAAARSSGLKQKDADRSVPSLTLSTIHRFKGLEKENVWVLDLVEGRFPHRRNPDQDEELRLLYVAVTRAKRNCILSYGGRALSQYVHKISQIREKLGVPKYR